MNATEKWYLKTPDKREVGPVSTDTIQQLAEYGRLRPEPLIRRGTEGRWEFARDIEGLLSPNPSSPTSHGKSVDNDSQRLLTIIRDHSKQTWPWGGLQQSRPERYSS